jgi:flavin-dependent dehydrogenase
MPSKERLANFRRDPARALVEFVGAVPEAPPIGASRLVGEVQGKLDMTNVAHTPTAPGLALIGDAALAIDPLWGVGCGWALQSAEWLADAVAPALAGDGSLARALRRYRRRHAHGLRGHSLMIYDYSRVRKMTPVERLMFGAAVHDERVAAIMEAFGTRCIGPGRMMRTAMPRSLAVAARQRLRRGAASDPAPRPVAAPSSGSATDVAR